MRSAILHFADDPTVFLGKVNAFFEQKDRRGVVSVDDPRLPRGWYGGSKMLECYHAIGAFNHLDLEALIRPLRASASDDDDLQLMVRAQEDDRFRLINVNEEPAAAP